MNPKLKTETNVATYVICGLTTGQWDRQICAVYWGPLELLGVQLPHAPSHFPKSSPQRQFLSSPGNAPSQVLSTTTWIIN